MIVPFDCFNGTINLSPHKNILTIALINIICITINCIVKCYFVYIKFLSFCKGKMFFHKLVTLYVSELIVQYIYVDIQFWRSRKSLEGLSVRSVFFNVFQSVIVLLYVWDNEANTIVIISCFVGLIIEIWKIHKVVDVTVSLLPKLFRMQSC